MTLVTVRLGNYRVFRNGLTNAGFLFPVLTYMFSSLMKLNTTSYHKELTGELTG